MLHGILLKPGEIKTNQSPHHEAHGLTLLTLLSNEMRIARTSGLSFDPTVNMQDDEKCEYTQLPSFGRTELHQL